MASTPWVMTFSACADLRLRVVLGRLHQHLVAGRLGGLLEERDIGIEIAERRLLLQHEGDLLGLARRAGACGGCAVGDSSQASGKRQCSGSSHQNPRMVHDFLPYLRFRVIYVIDNSA